MRGKYRRRAERRAERWDAAAEQQRVEQGEQQLLAATESMQAAKPQEQAEQDDDVGEVEAVGTASEDDPSSFVSLSYERYRWPGSPKAQPVYGAVGLRLYLGEAGRSLYYVQGWLWNSPIRKVDQEQRWREALRSVEQDVREQVRAETGLEIDLWGHLMRMVDQPGKAEILVIWVADGTCLTRLEDFRRGKLRSGRPAPSMSETRARGLLAEARRLAQVQRSRLERGEPVAPATLLQRPGSQDCDRPLEGEAG